MRTITFIVVLLVVIEIVAFAAGWSADVLALYFLLAIGFLMAPFRAYQVAVGALTHEGWVVKGFFLLTMVFWLGVVWAFINMHLLRHCSGDNCLGYFLIAAPFPFAYAVAEVLLLKAQSRTKRIQRQA